MRRVILGTVIAMALITGCSEDKADSAECTKASAEFNAAIEEWQDYIDYVKSMEGKTDVLTMVAMNSNLVRLGTIAEEKLKAKKRPCGIK